MVSQVIADEHLLLSVQFQHHLGICMCVWMVVRMGLGMPVTDCAVRQRLDP